MRLPNEDKQFRNFVIEQNRRHRNRQIVRLLLFIIGFLVFAQAIESFCFAVDQPNSPRIWLISSAFEGLVCGVEPYD